MSAANIKNHFSSAYAGTRPDESLNLPGQARAKMSNILKNLPIPKYGNQSNQSSLDDKLKKKLAQKIINHICSRDGKYGVNCGINGRFGNCTIVFGNDYGTQICLYCYDDTTSTTIINECHDLTQVENLANDTFYLTVNQALNLESDITQLTDTFKLLS
jgi:hypothetical protein